MTVLSFIFTVIITAKSIVHEKETGVKEAMKLMGMKTWIYWLSWYNFFTLNIKKFENKDVMYI